MEMRENLDGFCFWLITHFLRNDTVWVVVDRYTSTRFLNPSCQRGIQGLHLDSGSNYNSLQKLNSVLVRYVLRLCIGLGWDKYLLLAWFGYNNYQSSIGMSPIKALYGRKCMSPACWVELREIKLIRPNLVHDTKEKKSNSFVTNFK
ncbi:DNA/RNA polymerases superfamily protein [Gossypium australe]|uniref:DNA/RNA polymerases superfamily protein n=1 Tax=Gossypium australe TaxID=47621 RepID=A0A5B6WEV7_9ROSI|nr:DNA/RNA polymerases superfamily protein [Gossypium australe]